MLGKKSKIKSLLCFFDGSSDTDALARKHGAELSPKAANANGAAAIPQRRRASSTSHCSEDSGKDEEDLLDRLRAMKIQNLRTLKDVALEGIKGEPINDKSYLMERIIQLATDLPFRSPRSETLTKSFLTQLWGDLEHPPKSYLGSKFTFRQADGSSNNLLWPHIGAAGQSYARTARPKMMQPVARPDPGVLFDSLLAREAFEPHPNSISSVLFYVASIIIHDIFHTSHKDFAISETSSYLDLAPLYGSSQEQQMLMRTRQNGRLKADCFSDVRILGFPPGVGVLLVFFNRFHNHVVENLAKIDENGRFSSILHPPGRPAPADGEELYDEALFQTGRLVTTGLYVNIILKDYVRTILNLNSVNSKWNLDPRSEEGKSLIRNEIPEALGNQVSAEFNLVYRWHSCISERDEAWTEAAFERIAGTGSAGLSMSELLVALQKWAATMPSDPQQRPFPDVQRQTDGFLPDDKLASIWIHSVEDIAGSFSTRHIPKVMRSVEMLGIVQARSWNLASLNEFREYFKLTPHEKFEDINSDPYIVEQLRNLYGHPDHVEIYPGVIVEEAKKSMSPGSGLCTNFTISRAILSDAVALVRSDRYYTLDYTPANLTNWGYSAADYNLSIDYGCVMHKLVLTALPDHIGANSIYAHYPLVTPSKNQGLLRSLGQAQFYDFTRPAAERQPRMVESCNADGPVAVLSSLPRWSAHRTALGGPATNGARKIIPSFTTHLTKHSYWSIAVKTFFSQQIEQHWNDRRYCVGDHQQIEVVRDVINTTYAELFQYILGVSNEELQEFGDDFDSKDLHGVFSRVFDSGCLASSTAYPDGYHRKQIKKLTALLETKVQRDKRPTKEDAEATFGTGQIQKLLGALGQETMVDIAQEASSAPELVWDHILPEFALMMVSASRLSAQFVDAILVDGAKHLDECRTLIEEESDHSMQTLDALIRQEASENAQNTLIITGSGNASEQAMNPTIDLVEELNAACMNALLQLLVKARFLERVPGPQGQLKHVKNNAGVVFYLNDKQSELSCCPSMLKVRWRVG